MTAAYDFGPLAEMEGTVAARPAVRTQPVGEQGEPMPVLCLTRCTAQARYARESAGRAGADGVPLPRHYAHWRSAHRITNPTQLQRGMPCMKF